MIKKQGNFIEAHIEKVALLIGVLGAMYIVYAFVLSNVEKVPFNGQSFSPSQIDIYIAEQSDKLRARLEREPVLKPAYIPQSKVFLEEMNSVLGKDLNVFWPVPSCVEITVDKKYRIPVVGEVNDVSVDRITAVAYIPKVAITPENVESEDSYEPNDLDLVTVQGSFDLGSLIDSFQECFAGKGIPEGWRDKDLAKPVFAGVQLQRQRLGENGEWSQWKDIPRLRIDPKRDIYKIIDNVSDLPMGGVMVQIAQLGDQRTQASMLQPDAYKIASAEEQWLPPVLHEKFLAVRREKEAQERREAATERETKTAEEREKTITRSTRDERGTGVPGGGGHGTTTGQPTGGVGGGASNRGPSGGAGSRVASGGASSRVAGGGGGRPMGTEPDRSGGSRNTLKTTSRTERDTRTETATTEQKKLAKTTVTEATINEELRKMLLRGKDISSLHDTITFWAHDDTVEPGASYHYRIRIGVFNPVAGTGQVQEEDAASNDKVILWSDFSEVTDIVDIPERLYFFPINVQEAARSVDVQVCKYVMGYWYSEQFIVKRGDIIGKTAKVEVSEKNKTADTIKDVKLPETIDYTTGAIVVDVVPMNEWFRDKVLQLRQYFDVLFSFDGTRVDRLPATLMNWPEDLRLKYSELKSLEKKTKEPLRDWNTAGTLQGAQRAMPVGGVDHRVRGPTDRGGDNIQDAMPNRNPGR
jgi:hypothetical protein